LTLHVGGPAAVESAAVTAGFKRVARPVVGIGGNDIGVAVENERPPAVRVPQRNDAGDTLSITVWERRHAREFRQLLEDSRVHCPRVPIESVVFEPVGEDVLGGLFGPTAGVDTEKTVGQRGEFVTVTGPEVSHRYQFQPRRKEHLGDIGLCEFDFRRAFQRPQLRM
jgi:hypothetical protein